jgi:hypothetical protein
MPARTLRGAYPASAKAREASDGARPCRPRLRMLLACSAAMPTSLIHDTTTKLVMLLTSRGMMELQPGARVMHIRRDVGVDPTLWSN